MTEPLVLSGVSCAPALQNVATFVAGWIVAFVYGWGELGALPCKPELC